MNIPSANGCWCCGDAAPVDAVTEWDGRLDGYCVDCALARCDSSIGACGKRKPAPAHSAPNGTVSVKMHKRRRLTLVVPREELDSLLIERVESLEKENRHLRRKVTELTQEAIERIGSGWSPSEPVDVEEMLRDA